jgi:hypothetical protein
MDKAGPDRRRTLMKKLLMLGVLTALSAFSQSSVETVVTPEPTTIGLMALGLAGVGYSAWRQKRKKK